MRASGRSPGQGAAGHFPLAGAAARRFAHAAAASPLVTRSAGQAAGRGSRAEPMAGLRAAARLGGLRPSDRWHPWPSWVDLAWVMFSLANLVAMLIFAQWETIPFHLIWISVTLLYGFRVWGTGPTLWVLAIVMVTTFLAIGLDVRRGTEPADELNEVPLMAAMFLAMVWHARRRLTAEQEQIRTSEENSRLLATQRRFLQDASHQLRTPITIALGHAELLAGELAGHQEKHDIHVVVGELARLRSLSERLLVIAAAENPDFLQVEPVALDQLMAETLRRWRPTAPRRWRLGRLDAVTASADAERLRLALDALLENAVQHTAAGDVITMSVRRCDDGPFAGLLVQDTGTGIPACDLPHIFDRFSTGSAIGGRRGTGLGLALTRAIAQGHGGEVRVHSTPGTGSRFEFRIPVTPPPADRGQEPAAAPAPAGDPGGQRNLR